MDAATIAERTRKGKVRNRLGIGHASQNFRHTHAVVLSTFNALPPQTTNEISAV
jgi:hypothetical protein